MALAPGTRLGPYEIAAPIGAGGMGEVYRARDTRLDRIVALKISKEEFTPDGRSDIFAFGLVLYEMLTGKRAFDGGSAASIIAAILERPAPLVSAVAPSALDRLLQRCLAKDPD